LGSNYASNITGVEDLHYLGKTKIGKVQPNTKTTYPLVRLPQECVETIGASAHLYKMQVEGQQVFLVVLGDDAGIDLIQKMHNIIQNSPDAYVKARLSALELQIAELKSLILKNVSYNNSENKKEAPESGFEPESEPRQGSMIGRYTTRACTSVMAA
jgi:hypothetical protein